MAKTTQAPKPAHPWAITAISANVHNIKITNIRPGWEQWVLLSSDRHHDNPHCRRDVEKRDLEVAKQRHAIVLDFGDLFCAMQGKYDPRRSMDSVLPEDKGDDYLDRIVAHADEFYGPYAKLFGLIGMGNHESNILSRVGTNLVDRLVDRLRQRGSSVQLGGYGGWVRFQLEIYTKHRQSILLKYHHGPSAGGQVTRGILDTARQAVYVPDAEIVVNGHTHDQYHLPIARERISEKGRLYRDIVHYIRTGTYKDEYASGIGGFHIEKGRPPKPLGAVWLRLHMDKCREEDHSISRVRADVMVESV